MLIISFVFGLIGPIKVYAAGPTVVNLLSADNFVILGKTAITTTGATSITGDIGISPAAATFITGFGLVMDVSNTFSNSSLVTGNIYAPNYAVPTPAYMTTAISNMEAAYTDAAGRTLPDGTELYGGLLGGRTFTPGLYKWTTDVSIPASGATSTDVTLSGGANDVWIFQIAGNLNVSSGGTIPTGAKVILTGGAQAKNVFWQVGGGTGATLGTYSTFNGNILSAKQIIMQTGAVLNGRALAQTQVTLDANTVSIPVGSGSATLHIIKLVINGSGGTALPGTAVPSSFNVHVKSAGVDVSGSPLAGTATPGTVYSLAAGTYTVSEDANSSYVRTFSGTGCDSSGNVTLAAGEDKTCTVINTDVPVNSVGGGGASSGGIVPVIGILKVPTPLALSAGSGSVTYDYTVWNVGGQQAITGVTVTDDKCSSLVFLSGDVNNNSKLDPGENWKYSCVTTLSQTTTNTSIATGYSDDLFHQAAIATAIATVVVSTPGLPSAGITTPPLINIVKVPNRLTPFAFGGGNVMYSYIVTNPGVVAMSNVNVTDDKCGPISGPFGDNNGNKLLDSGESWAYACQTKVSVSTRNVATAEGKANGFTALGYAFATVLVSTVPGLPNTGFPSDQNTVPWNLIMMAGALIFISASIVVILKKRTI